MKKSKVMFFLEEEFYINKKARWDIAYMCTCVRASLRNLNAFYTHRSFQNAQFGNDFAEKKGF